MVGVKFNFKRKSIEALLLKLKKRRKNLTDIVLIRFFNYDGNFIGK